MSSNKLKFISLADNGTQAAILEVVRDYAPISRNRIAEFTGLSIANVSRATSNLLSRKIVIEIPKADHHGPRRKRGLKINNEIAHVLSVEYGPRGIEGSIVDAIYKPVFTDAEKVPMAALSRKEKISRIVNFTKKLQDRASTVPGQCLGLAVIDPGVVSPAAGTTVSSATMADWIDVPIVEILQEHLKIPVMLSNSMAAKIRAVDRIEVQGHAENILYIEYGTGIACGMKLNDHYISGSSGMAGEFGHMRVTDRVIHCRCGSRGCLEAVSALPALARDARDAMTEDSRSCLGELDKITGLDVLRAAAGGDKLAFRIVENAFDYLGWAIAGIVNLLDPKILLLDNNISKAGKDIVDMFMLSLNRKLSTFHSNNIDTRISRIESHLGSFGGAAMVLDSCLHPS